MILGASSALTAQPAPLERGVNLSGWFQSPDARQLPLSRYGTADFENLRALGVDGVRLPVNFAAFVGPGPEYRLDVRLLAPLDEAIDGLLAHGLGVILDNHSDWDLPRFRADREGVLKALWAQLSARYRDRGPGLVYEIQNEPHDIAASVWDTIQRRVLEVIRRNDKRTVVVTGAEWGGVTGLLALKPYDDKNLLYSFHFYDPFRFTHQGAEWAGQGNLSGVRFPSGGDVDAMNQTLDSVTAFARAHGLAVYCGEFGVYNRVAAPADRVAWYRTLRTMLEDRRIPWSLWDYRDSFGLFRKGSAEVFENDLDPDIVAALGLRTVPQTPAHSVVAQGFDLYRDAWGAGTRESAWAPGGVVDFANPDRPQEGRASLLVSGVDRYSSVAWDFAPQKDLSRLAGHAELVFWARSNARSFSVDLRFIDGAAAGTDGLPWRMTFTLDQSVVPGDGAWHRVAVPLSAMRDAGAWDGSWHNAQPGAFDWKRVARFEIAAEQRDLRGVELGFDAISVVE